MGVVKKYQIRNQVVCKGQRRRNNGVDASLTFSMGLRRSQNRVEASLRLSSISMNDESHFLSHASSAGLEVKTVVLASFNFAM